MNGIVNLKSLVIQILCMVQFCLAGIASAGQIDDVRASVDAWQKSWQNRDISSYMSFYSPNFRSEGLDYKGWMQKKTKLFKTSGDIEVEITDLGVERCCKGRIFLQGVTTPVLVRRDALDTTVNQWRGKTLHNLHGFQEVMNHYGHHDVQFHLAGLDRHCNGQIVSHHLKGNHIEAFQHDRVHLPGHDRGARLDRWKVNLGQPSCWSRTQESKIIGYSNKFECQTSESRG